MIVTNHDWLDQVPTMTKIRQDNYLTDHIDEVYVENEIKLSWSIKASLGYNENQTR